MEMMVLGDKCLALEKLKREGGSPELECVMLPVHRLSVAGGQSRITGGIVQLRFS